MALPNAYAQYKNSKVLTASPAELTLMLYQGAIKFCNIAIAAIEQKEVEKAHINIRKAQKERDAQEAKDKIASYKSHGSVQNTTTKNELTKSVQVVKR